MTNAFSSTLALLAGTEMSLRSMIANLCHHSLLQHAAEIDTLTSLVVILLLSYCLSEIKIGFT